MGKVFVNDTGTLREMVGLFINHGGILRDIKALYINDTGTLRRIFVKLFLAWTTGTATLRSSGKTTAPSTANFTVNLAGDVTGAIVNQINNTISGQKWLSTYPDPDTGANGWTVKIDDVSSGATVTFTTLNEGQEYTMDVARTFNFENQTPNSEGQFSLNITFDDKAGTIVSKALSLRMPVGTQP